MHYSKGSYKYILALFLNKLIALILTCIIFLLKNKRLAKGEDIK